MEHDVAAYLTEWSERMTRDLHAFELCLKASVAKGELTAEEAAQFLLRHGYTHPVAILRVGG